jgi:hypothetical protein
MTRTVCRVLLAGLAAGSVVVGVWAQFFPVSFYEDFPAIGAGWISTDGAFNEHLVRDVGGLNLALASVTIAAALRPGRWLIQVAAVAWLLYAVPHLLYHLHHLDPLATSDQVGIVASLAYTVVAPIAVLTLSVLRADDFTDPGPTQ